MIKIMAFCKIFKFCSFLNLLLIDKFSCRRTMRITSKLEPSDSHRNTDLKKTEYNVRL